MCVGGGLFADKACEWDQTVEFGGLGCVCCGLSGVLYQTIRLALQSDVKTSHQR